LDKVRTALGALSHAVVGVAAVGAITGLMVVLLLRQEARMAGAGALDHIINSLVNMVIVAVLVESGQLVLSGRVVQDRFHQLERRMNNEPLY
jgi:hypothetical protein